MSNSFSITSNTLDAEDFVLLLLALDLLDRHTHDELAKAGHYNNLKNAPLIQQWSRILLVRAKLRRMQGGGQ